MADAPLQGLRIRKHADKTSEERIGVFDPETGEKRLINPASGQEEPWPLAGVSIVLAPNPVRIPTSFVSKGRSEGWIEVEGEDVEHVSGGPESDPWKVTHTFVKLDRITLKTRDGDPDVSYRVIHQPGKYDDASEPSGVRFDWFYDAELED